MTTGIVQGAISAIEKTIKAAKEYNEATSGIKLSRLTKGLSVEPVCFVDSQLVYQEYMSDIMQACNSFFIATWLQGVSVLANPSKVEAMAILDQVNPNRDPEYSALVKRIHTSFSREGMYWSPENYKHGLPSNNSAVVKMAAEAARDTGRQISAETIFKVEPELKDKDTQNLPIKTADMSKAVAEAPNLAVGKMVSVTIPTKTAEGKIIENEFQIRIRLMAVEMNHDTMLRLASDKSEATSFKERFFDWRLGRIGLMDLMFCRDLMKERKKQLLRDKGGVYTQIKERQGTALRAGVTSGKASAGEATNIMVISDALAQRITVETGLDLDEYQDRQKIFDVSSAMMIVRVNPVDLRVRFYHEGSKRFTSLGINELRAANKKSQNGPNLMELFEALQQGSQPRF